MKWVKHAKGIKQNIKKTIYNIFFTIKMCWSSSKYRLLLIISLKAVIGVIPTLILLVWRNFINYAVDALNGNLNSIKKCIISILVYCFVLLIKDILSRVVDYYFKWEADYLNKYITDICLNKIETMSAAELDNSENYNLLNKANEQSADRIYNVLCSIFLFVESLITFLSTATLLSGLSIVPVVLSIISTVPSFIISMNIVEEYYNIFNNRYEKHRFIAHLKHIMFNSNNAKEIRLCRNGSYFRNFINTTYERFMKEDGRLRRKNAIKSSVAQVFDFTFLYASKIYIIVIAIKKQLSIGTLSMNITAVEQFVGSISNLLEIVKELYNNNLYMDSLHELEQIGKTSNKKETLSAEEVTRIRSFRFENVSFRYGNEPEYILHNLSYRFDVGKRYCIVGDNGSGKSTLIKLLSCLYEPDEGKIFINEKETKHYSKEDIYKHINMMFQNYIKYPLSIAENIGMGQVENMEDIERMKEVSRISGSAEFIRKTDKGYRTMLQKEWTNGIDLSGGEWQRLAIDRTIFGDGDVYIFDEPTSAIDVNAEKKFFDWLKYEKDKIIIYIVHKMNLACMADEIIVMQNGKIAESGTYEKLMRKKGIFYEMLQNENNLREVG